MKEEKIKLVKHILKKIKSQSKKHYKKFRKLKKIQTVGKVTINFLNTVSVTSLVITFTALPPVVIISLISSSLSALGSGVMSIIDLSRKITTHQSAYLQLKDIHDSYEATLLKNHLNSEDLDDILKELNVKMGLILDNATNEAVSEDSSSESKKT